MTEVNRLLKEQVAREVFKIKQEANAKRREKQEEYTRYSPMPELVD